MQLSKTARRNISLTLSYILLSAGALVILIPLTWMLSTSLKDEGQVFKLPIRWIPTPIRWGNYALALTMFDFGQFFTNSFKISALAILGAVLSSSVVAYSLARLRWKGRDVVFLLVLASLMLPHQVTIIPLFVIYRQINWLNTHWPLIAPYWFAGSFFVFLLRQFFMTIPAELDDAALIDGCSKFGIFWRIIFPLAKPAITSVAIFTFQWTWNDFFRPLIFLNQQQKWTVALGLRAFDNMGWGNRSWSQLMAAALTSLLPMVIVFFVMQRYFIQGVVFTGLKG